MGRVWVGYGQGVWAGMGKGMGRARAGLQILQKYQIDSVGIEL